MIEIERDRFAHLVATGAALGPYDEMPIIPRGIDPQVTLSRNDRPQPFALICEHDTVLAVLAGRGRVVAYGPCAAVMPLGPGDHLYLPARTPHRVVPEQPMIQLRYKAEAAGLEAAAWFCDRCSAEVWRHEFEVRATPHLGWLAAVDAFNADRSRRTCGCGRELPTVDLTGFRWQEMADALVAEALEATS